MKTSREMLLDKDIVEEVLSPEWERQFLARYEEDWRRRNGLNVVRGPWNSTPTTVLARKDNDG